VSGLSNGAGGTERNRRRVDGSSTDCDLGLHRLAAAAVPVTKILPPAKWRDNRAARALDF